MRRSALMLLFIATGFGMPYPKNSKKIVAIFNNASNDVGFVVHNIRRRRSAPGDGEFNLEENLLDMNEDTMQLAMKEEAKALPQNKDLKKEAKQDNDDSGVNFKRKGDLDSFNLGEEVQDMNEETLELAMEEEEEEEEEEEDGVHIAQAMEKKSSMMEVMDESDLERELEEADKAPESKIPWNLVGLGLGIGAAVLFVVALAVCCCCPCC